MAQGLRAGLLVNLATIVMVLFSIVAASAQTPTLREINSINGFDEAMQGIASSLAKIPPEAEAISPPNFGEAWALATDGILDTKVLLASIEEKMAGKLSPSQLQELLVFYDSPFGRRITRLEIEAGREEDEEKKAEGTRILAEVRENDPERYRLYMQMIDDLAIMETSEAIAMNAGYAMLVGMFAAAQSPVAPSEQLIMQLLQGQRPKIREAIAEAVLSSTAYGYRELTLEDLKRYTEFLASGTANRYYREMLSAMDATLSQTARTLGHRLAEALGQRKA